MSDVGQALQHVWNEAHQGRIVTRIVGFAVQDRLIREGPKVRQYVQDKVRDLETRLVAEEKRRGVRS